MLCGCKWSQFFKCKKAHTERQRERKPRPLTASFLQLLGFSQMVHFWLQLQCTLNWCHFLSKPIPLHTHTHKLTHSLNCHFLFSDGCMCIFVFLFNLWRKLAHPSGANNVKFWSSEYMFEIHIESKKKKKQYNPNLSYTHIVVLVFSKAVLFDTALLWYPAAVKSVFTPSESSWVFFLLRFFSTIVVSLTTLQAETAFFVKNLVEP